MAQIGTLRERPLHSSVRQWYARRGDRAEVPVDGYVIDLVQGDTLVEIQTRGFSSMKRKVAALLAGGHRLRIVHPIAVDRWIVRVGADSGVISRRRSPRHGSLIDIVTELVSFPDLLANANLEVDVLLTEQEELRRHAPGSCWRRGGWIVVERRLLRVVDSVLIAGPADLARLLPSSSPARFTTADLAADLALPRRVAQQLAYCLRAVGVIAIVGKRAHALEYELSPAVDRPS